MRSASIALLLICYYSPVLSIAASDDVAPRPIRMIRDAVDSIEMIDMNKDRTVAVFRFTNATKQSITLSMRGKMPDLWIQRLKDGKSKTVYSQWCGWGIRNKRLDPGASVDWSVDVLMYRREYGTTLRFVRAVKTKAGFDLIPSKPFDFSGDAIVAPQTQSRGKVTCARRCLCD